MALIIQQLKPTFEIITCSNINQKKQNDNLATVHQQFLLTLDLAGVLIVDKALMHQKLFRQSNCSLSQSYMKKQGEFTVFVIYSSLSSKNNDKRSVRLRNQYLSAIKRQFDIILIKTSQMPKVKPQQEDDLFIPNPRRTYQKKVITRREGRKFNSSTWNYKQNQVYVKFLIDQQTVISDSSERIKHKIFAKMSTAIKTRTSIQCRSHHQKMINKHQTVQKIIKTLLLTACCPEPNANIQQIPCVQSSPTINLGQNSNVAEVEPDLNHIEFQQFQQDNQNLWQMIDSNVWSN